MKVNSPLDVLEDGELRWKNTVVAQFVGRIPNFSAFQNMVNMLWGEHGEMDLKPTGQNLFVIQFSNEFIRDRVLEARSWHI